MHSSSATASTRIGRPAGGASGSCPTASSRAEEAIGISPTRPSSDMSGRCALRRSSGSAPWSFRSRPSRSLPAPKVAPRGSPAPAAASAMVAAAKAADLEGVATTVTAATIARRTATAAAPATAALRAPIRAAARSGAPGAARGAPAPAHRAPPARRATLLQRACRRANQPASPRRRAAVYASQISSSATASAASTRPAPLSFAAPLSAATAAQ